MIVNQHNQRRLHGNRHAEPLTRMHQQGVHRADGHQMMPLYPPPRVQEQHNETLAIRVEIRMRCNMQPPVVNDLLRLFTDLHLLRHGAIPQGDDFEFLGIEVLHAPTSATLGGGVIFSVALTTRVSGPFPRMKSAAFCACAAAWTMSVLSSFNCFSQPSR